MQLCLTTDYAIRIVMYLSVSSRVVTSREIHANLKISQGYVFKVMKRLMDANFVHVQRGVHGGFYLVKKDISLLEIVEVMECTMKINQCLEANNKQGTCDALYQVYAWIQRDLELKMEEIKLCELA